MVKYDSNADVGDNLCGKISSDEILDVSKLPSQFIVLLSNFEDWKIDGELPNNIIPYSLSQNMGCDDYVVIMLASNKHNTKKRKRSSQWMKKFVKVVKATLNKTVVGNGKQHHGSVGNYYGLGTTAKYSIISKCSYGTVSQKGS